MKKIIDSIKYIQPKDLFSPFIFIFILPFSFVFKLINKIKKRELWLICESGDTARDNGYHLFKYIRENYPNDYCFYVIDKKCADYQKVKKYGNIIQFKSLKHWLYYLSAGYNISSQKHGNPNQIFFYFIHVSMGLYKNRVFLQHGITKDMCDWLTYKNTKFKYFICGAKREYEYVSKEYGYPSGNVQYTGLARFDNLHNFTVNKNEILVMPTWRNWLGRETNSVGQKVDFLETDYFKYWNSFLNDRDLQKYIEDNNIKILFYPHINMQKYLSYFKTNSKNIKILDLSTPIQEVLKSSALLITDYSSVYMDFGYMRKEVLYYQFDLLEYRKKQYQEGYFNYDIDGFGPVIKDKKNLVEYIKKMHQNNFLPEEKYKQRMNSFFELNDKKNCERHYKLLKRV